MDVRAAKINRGGALAPPLPAPIEVAKTTSNEPTGPLSRKSDLELPCIVAEWQKNNRETVRITISEYQGHSIVDCRQWYSDKTGELKPTPKGLTLSLAHLPALASGLADALNFASMQGLLPNDKAP